MGMLYIILIFIIWSWGLTPTWVNVVVTIMASLVILSKFAEVIKNEY